MYKSKGWKGILWILPSLLGVTIFYCFPWLDVIRRSVSENAGSTFVGLKNFQKVFQNEAFQLATKNTLRFIVVCVPILLIISLLFAVIVMRCRWGNFYKWAFLFPMALPAVSVALIWKLLFHNHGIINAAISAFRMDTIDWINNPASFWILVLSYLWRNTGYNVILWMAGLRQIDSSIYEAARVDGAGEIKIFFSIILPNMKQIFYTVAVLSMLNSFKAFREAYLVAGNYPHDSMYLMQHLFNNWFAALSLDKMSAASVLLSIVILLFIIVLYKTWGKELA